MRKHGMKKRTSAFIVAGTNSSAGKTVLTLALMGALKRRGLVVQPFKAGPDYIDPGHHGALLKRPSYNLDTWMMGVEGVARTFGRAICGADIGVVEGVMGLYDGRDGTGDEGSTAHIAKILNLPVLLVVNAEKTARSAGAAILGFESYDPAVNIKWVVFNRVGSERHFRILKDSVRKGPGGSRVRVLGYLPKDEGLMMPERHLGLTTASEMGRGEWGRFVRKAVSVVERSIDLDGLIRSLPKVRGKEAPVRMKQGAAVRVAVAFDRAFSFYYEENLEVLRGAGAEVVFFSPMKDKRLPRNTDGVYIGGGYPELYAKELEANAALREEILAKAKDGMPVFAECGGLMYLGRRIGTEGKEYGTVGVFPWTTRMLKKRKALGYREAQLTEDCPFLQKGVLRGHEFHYSETLTIPRGIKRGFVLTDSAGRKVREGYAFKNTLASYMHVHFASNPEFAGGFVKRCAGWRGKAAQALDR